jgi:hypothetical protein
LDLPGPRPTAGHSVALLSFGHDCADLWVFPAPAEFPIVAGLSLSAFAALRTAEQAVGHTLPILAHGRLRTLLAGPQVGYLHSWSVTGGRGQPPETVSGASFGLGFGLALAAHALDARLADDFIAAASLDSSSAVGAVDLTNKLNLLAELTGVSRLVVAKEQAAEASAQLAALGCEHVTVVGVADLAQALDTVLERGFAGLPVRRAVDDRARQRIIRYLRNVVRQGIPQTCAWAPLCELALAAVDVWQAKLPADTLHELEYLASVAWRHQPTRPQRPPLPPISWFQGLPAQGQVEVLANYVQHATDVDPTVYAQLVPFLEPALAGIADTDAGAKLLGAHGRYRQLVAGQGQRALAELTQAAEHWWDSAQFSEINRPLCALVRLTAAMRQQDAFKLWSARAQELLVDGLLSISDEDFLRLAMGTGFALLDDWESALPHLQEASKAPNYVAASALRWLALGQLAGTLPPGNAHAELAAKTGYLDRWFQMLAALDTALVNGETAGGEARELVGAKPQGLALLLAGIPEAEWPHRVQRFYPY